MLTWTGFLYFSIFPLVSAEFDSRFLQDLIHHHHFHPSVWNIMTCSERDSINLIKMLSARFQRFVAAHDTDKALSPFSEEPQNFALDLRCPEAMTVLHQAEDLNLFRKPFQWLLLKDGIDPSTAYRASNISGEEETWLWPFLQTLTILVDSDVKVAEKTPNDKITLTGAYKITDVVVKELLAEWSSSEGFQEFNSKPLPVRRWNLQGLVFPSTVVVNEKNSANHFNDLVDKHVDTTSKVSYNMVSLFGDMFNISIQFKVRFDWGVFVNGSWTGMAGELERKEIEFSGSPLFVQKSRLRIVEYYASVTPTKMKFIFLSPPLSYSTNIFVLPFDRIVWYCCWVTVVVSCFSIYTALKYEKSHSKASKQDPRVSFTEILVLNIGAFCLQGTVAETKNPSGRIITIFLYFSYMFLNVSYSASIVAILQSSDTSIQTLGDLLRSQMKAGAEDVSYSRYYFQNSDGKIRRAFYKTKIVPKGESPHFLSMEEGVKKIRKGFFAYHAEVSSVYRMIQKTFTEEEKCGIQEMRDSFYETSDPFLIMKKGSPYSEHLKIGMKMCIERGIKSRFVQRYYTKKPVCTARSSRFASVGIIDCSYAFILLSAGLMTAFLIMLLEITYKGYQVKRKKRSDYWNYTPRIEFLN